MDKKEQIKLIGPNVILPNYNRFVNLNFHRKVLHYSYTAILGLVQQTGVDRPIQPLAYERDLRWTT